MIDTLPTTAAPVEPTTPIRPSEALRLGRLMFPVRIAGDLFDGSTGACALGAIIAGSGGRDDDGYGFLLDRFPGLRAPARCPDDSCPYSEQPSEGTDVVYHLNDLHDWTDIQIAGWLRERGL